ncbi:MAG TPA: sugar phosphate isomerase/epimerase [Planctomycetaceae bacterium]|nr:sugar phosphate isomerase/epimerase [Planctomycetaceae bacterium]
MDRRNFLVLSTASATAAAITNSATAIEPFDRPSPGVLRGSLAAYSMRKYLTMPKGQAKSMDLFGFVDYCKQLGLSGTELTSYYFPEGADTDYVLRLRRHCHLAGMTVSGGAIRNDFCSQDSGKVAADIAHTKKWIDLYALLGTPVIRIFAGNQPKGEELSRTLARCAKHCQTVCDYAADKGVMLGLENHGGVTARAEGLLEIVHQVDSPALGINFDSGNFRVEDPYAELEKIAKYAINAQIKVEVYREGKKVPSDLPRVASILKDAGYSGWVALEYEAAEDPHDAIPGWTRELLKVLA